MNKFTQVATEKSYSEFIDDNTYLCSEMNSKNPYFPTLEDFKRYDIQVMTEPEQLDGSTNKVVRISRKDYNSIDEFKKALPLYSHLYQITHGNDDINKVRVLGVVQ